MKLSDLKLTDVKLPANTGAVAKQIFLAMSVVGLAMVATTAFGAGFEDSAKKADDLLKMIIKWGVILAGSVATIVLLIKFVQAWNGHMDWLEFGKLAFFIACAGGVTTVSAYLFGAFQ